MPRRTSCGRLEPGGPRSATPTPRTSRTSVTSEMVRRTERSSTCSADDRENAMYGTARVGQAVWVFLASVVGGWLPVACADGELLGGQPVRVTICRPAVFPDGKRGFTSGQQALWKAQAGTTFVLGAATTRRGDYARVDFTITHHDTRSVDTVTISLAPRWSDRASRALHTTDACTIKAVARSGRSTAVVLQSTSGHLRCLVGGAGFGPARGLRPPWILSPMCLPFHHPPGVAAMASFYRAGSGRARAGRGRSTTRDRGDLPSAAARPRRRPRRRNEWP